jgi:Flp pilus assembly protein TadD
MSSPLNWLRKLRTSHVTAPADSSAASAANAPDEVLVRARALAAAGRTDEASETYWQIKKKHLSAAALVEHAEILLGMGDYFGATSRAARALTYEPENARAKAVQARVRKNEEEEQRRATRESDRER